MLGLWVQLGEDKPSFKSTNLSPNSLISINVSPLKPKEHCPGLSATSSISTLSTVTRVPERLRPGIWFKREEHFLSSSRPVLLSPSSLFAHTPRVACYLSFLQKKTRSSHFPTKSPSTIPLYQAHPKEVICIISFSPHDKPTREILSNITPIKQKGN